MMMRRVVAVLGAVTMVAGLGLVAGSPVGAEPAPPKAKSIVVSVTPASPVATTATKLTVSITPKGGGQPKGGVVTFLDGDTPIATATATTRMTSASVRLAVGVHSITASYAGDSVTAPGASTPVEITVGPAVATTTVTVAPNPVEPGAVAEIKARVRPVAPADPSGQPTGTVRFSTPVATATVKVNSNGVATWRKVLPLGEHNVTATYSGDATYTAGAPGSAVVTVAEPASQPGLRIAAGSYHTCAIVVGGVVRCWGLNISGALGDGTQTSSSTPVTVTGLTGAVALADTGNGQFSCALLDDGTARCWGEGGAGQLGNGAMSSSSTPVVVTGLTDAVSIVGGASHACALLDDGTVRCWGYNGNGQLGDGTTTWSSTPVAVTGVTGAVAITAGGYHTCAVLDDGTARCWGRNHDGQLGDGSTTGATTAVTVSGLSDVVDIDAGHEHTCAIVGDGTARCWGRNQSWQLGDGTNTQSPTPVTVTGLADATTITAGYTASCAIVGDGTARCWGAGGEGQLGNGTWASSSAPVVVSGLTDAVQITAGENHMCALVADGGARCWGYNFNGGLGNGENTDSSTPVAVVDLIPTP